MNKLIKNNSKRGFTILVAVVTAGILLIVAMSIGGIALKEQVLSSASKESQVAFYAADTGMECALYLDLKKGIFGPDVDGNSPTEDPSGTCNGLSIDFTENLVAIASPGDPHVEYSYSFKVSGIPVGAVENNVTTCAIVKITKDTNDSSRFSNPQNASKTHTDVEAHGYNTCDSSLTRIERGIEGHY